MCLEIPSHVPNAFIRLSLKGMKHGPSGGFEVVRGRWGKVGKLEEVRGTEG